MPELDLAEQLLAYVDTTTEPVSLDRVIGAAVVDLDEPRRARVDSPAAYRTGSPGPGGGDEERVRSVRRRLVVAAVGAAAAVAIAVVALVNVGSDEEGGLDIVDSPSTTVEPPATTTTVDGRPPPVEAPLVRTVPVEAVREPFGMGDMVNRQDQVTVVELSGPSLLDVVEADGSLWTATETPDRELVVRRIDPGPEALIAEIPIMDGYFADVGAPAWVDSSTTVFAEAGSVWATTRGQRVLHRIDPSTNEVVANIALTDDVAGSSSPRFTAAPRLASAASPAGLWVSGGVAGWIGRVDLESNELEDVFEVGPGPQHTLAFADGSLWRGIGDRVDRINPATGAVVASFDLNPPVADAYGLIGSVSVAELVATDDALWVIATGVAFRIDPATDQVVAAIPLLSTDATVDAAISGETLLVALGPSLYALDITTGTATAGSGLMAEDAVGDLASLEGQLWMRRIDRNCTAGCSHSLARIPLQAVTAPSGQ